jgi:hypothetical protein
MDILTGLMMGDGSLDHSSKNPRINCRSIEVEFLEHLDDKFGSLSSGVTLERTSKQLANNSSSTLPNRSTLAEDYNDVYAWNTRKHPELSSYMLWYDSGNKVFPDNIRLTPNVLTYWYVCDGSLSVRKTKTSETYTIKISIANERNNIDKIYSYFQQSGLPEPNRSHKFERDNGTIGCNIEWNKDESSELLRYMCGPVPGYEYKFPDQKV